MKRFLLLVAGLLLIGFLSIICFENKAESIKSNIINQVASNLHDRQIWWAKPSIVGDGYKSTEIVALNGVAPTKEKKSEAVEVTKNTRGVWAVKDFLKIEKVEKVEKKVVLIQPKIINVEPKIKENVEENICETKLHNLLKNSSIHFETSKSVIKSDSFELLSKIANIIKQCSKYKVEIAGYTDSDGKEEDNLLLSAKRADEVKNYLVDKEKVDANNLMPRGYGEANPIASNKTKEGRAKNRRIEFNILGGE